MLLNQAHSAFANFRGKLALFFRDSIFLDVGDSSNPEAIQTDRLSHL